MNARELMIDAMNQAWRHVAMIDQDEEVAPSEDRQQDDIDGFMICGSEIEQHPAQIRC